MPKHIAAALSGAAPLGASLKSLEQQLAAPRPGKSKKPDPARPEGHDKWRIIDDLTEARSHYGLSVADIVVLKALCSFHRGQVLRPGDQLVVFPSNRTLSKRASGMPPATLRRHLGRLASAGLIERRDSPNGKRYPIKDETGAIVGAFGLDLGPLFREAPRIFEQGARARAATVALKKARTSISLLRKNIRKAVDAAEAQGPEGDWTHIRERLVALSGKIPKKAPLAEITQCRDALAVLWSEVPQRLPSATLTISLGLTGAQNERHIQKQKPEPYRYNSDTPPQQGVDHTGPSQEGTISTTSAGPRLISDVSEELRLERVAAAVSLEAVLSYCPDIRDYARQPIRSWRDLVSTTQGVWHWLGRALDAWEKAVDQFGEIEAAIVVAAILQRAQDIRSPAAYLRGLTKRASQGKFSLTALLEGARPAAPAV